MYWYARTPCENWDIFFGQNSDHMNIKSDCIIDGQHETLTETLFIKGEKEIMICEEKYFFLGYI